MSSNTKQVLAITLGALGLALGILGTVVAYNAKKAADDNVSVTSQVQTEFAAAQAQQDAKEQAQVSGAERFVNKLSKSEKSTLKYVNQNAALIKKNKKMIRSLKKQVNSLESRDAELAAELTATEEDQRKDYNKLNKRINNTNAEVNQLQRSVQNLRNTVDVLEASS